MRAPPRSPPSACRSRCRNTAPAARARSAPPRSCPRCRARRSRRAPGCRARPSSWRTASVSASNTSRSIQSRLTRTLLAMPPWAIASAKRFVAVRQMRVLADDGDRHLALGLADAADDLVPAVEIGLGRVEAEMRADLAVEALGVIGARAPRRSCRRRAPESPAPRADCRTARSSCARLRGIGRSQRHSRMSGWMPRPSSSFAECWVGLVFSSPADGMYGTRVRCTNSTRSRPELVAELADRLEERQALDVADRAADLAQDEILAVEIGLDEFLDRVGDVRDHLHGARRDTRRAARGRSRSNRCGRW